MKKSIRVVFTFLASSGAWGCGGASSRAVDVEESAGGQQGAGAETAPDGAGGERHAGAAGTRAGKGGSGGGSPAGEGARSGAGGAMGHSGDGGSAGRSDDGGGSGRMDGFGGDGEGGHGFAERCECEITFEDATCQVGAADFEAMFPIPSDCENDLDYVTISTCADGTRRYHWLEAMENAYDVVIDAESGALLYGAAWGYVTSACGVTRVDHGAISFGPRPEESACTTTDICRTDGEGGAGGRRGSAG